MIINRSKDSNSIDKNDILRPNLVIWNSHYLDLLLLFLSSSLAVVLREPTAPSNFHRQIYPISKVADDESEGFMVLT